MQGKWEIKFLLLDQRAESKDEERNRQTREEVVVFSVDKGNNPDQVSIPREQACILPCIIILCFSSLFFGWNVSFLDVETHIHKRVPPQMPKPVSNTFGVDTRKALDVVQSKNIY